MPSFEGLRLKIKGVIFMVVSAFSGAHSILLILVEKDLHYHPISCYRTGLFRAATESLLFTTNYLVVNKERGLITGLTEEGQAALARLKELPCRISSYSAYVLMLAIMRGEMISVSSYPFHYYAQRFELATTTYNHYSNGVTITHLSELGEAYYLGEQGLLASHFNYIFKKLSYSQKTHFIRVCGDEKFISRQLLSPIPTIRRAARDRLCIKR